MILLIFLLYRQHTYIPFWRGEKKGKPNPRNAELCPKCQHWPWGSLLSQPWHRLGSTVSCEPPPAMSPSQHFQGFHSKNRDIQIYIIHSPLMPVPCPKMLTVFNFVWTMKTSWCIPGGFTVPGDSRGSGHCQPRGNVSSWLTMESQLMASNHDRPLNYFDSLFVTGKWCQLI